MNGVFTGAFFSSLFFSLSFSSLFFSLPFSSLFFSLSFSSFHFLLFVFFGSWIFFGSERRSQNIQNFQACLYISVDPNLRFNRYFTSNFDMGSFAHRGTEQQESRWFISHGCVFERLNRFPNYRARVAALSQVQVDALYASRNPDQPKSLSNT